MESLLFVVTVLPILGSLIQMFIYKKEDAYKANVANTIVLLEMAACAYLFMCMTQNGSLYYALDYVCGLGLSFKLDGFRAVYSLIAAFMWLMTTLFNKEYFHHYKNKTRYIYNYRCNRGISK